MAGEKKGTSSIFPTKTGLGASRAGFGAGLAGAPMIPGTAPAADESEKPIHPLLNSFFQLQAIAHLAFLNNFCASELQQFTTFFSGSSQRSTRSSESASRRSTTRRRTRRTTRRSGETLGEGIEGAEGKQEIAEEEARQQRTREEKEDMEREQQRRRAQEDEKGMELMGKVGQCGTRATAAIERIYRSPAATKAVARLDQVCHPHFSLLLAPLLQHHHHRSRVDYSSPQQHDQVQDEEKVVDETTLGSQDWSLYSQKVIQTLEQATAPALPAPASAAYFACGRELESFFAFLFPEDLYPRTTEDIEFLATVTALIEESSSSSS